MSVKPVLIILHQEHSTPGRVGRLLLEKGVPLDMRRPRFGDPLPETMAEHSGAVIFGGPMSANDPEEWIAQETAWIDVCLRDNAPFLGICLGAQMLARQLGGAVWFHRKNKIEAGYYPIHITDAGVAAEAEIGARWPRTVYQWHREGFTCPSGCTLLATGDAFAEQAFRFGDKAWGLQFHPEVTYAMINRWTTRAWERLEMAHARPREAHLADWFTYDAAVARWLGAFLDHWLGLTPQQVRPQARARQARVMA